MNESKKYDAGNNSYITTLSGLSRGDVACAGAKATNLGELLAAGFPVPGGFVVTTNAFDRFLKYNDLTVDASQKKVDAAFVPADIVEAVLTAVSEIGDIPVAVRSSGVAEDLADASFAGQYESLIDVRGEDAIVSAIRYCWESTFSKRVLAYRGTQAKQNNFGMAVLVQHLVLADIAGVAFSANPVTGERDEVVVSAVKGLGERLVSGQTSPDEWLVRGDEAVCQRAPEGVLDAAQALSVAELARRAESHFGVPQDIEWAVSDGKLYILQARPITALPQPPELPDFSNACWQKDDAHCASLLTPFGASVFLPAVDYGASVAFREFGLPIEGTEQLSVGGEIYLRIIPLGGKEPSGPALPSWVLSLAVRLIPSMRRRRRISEEAFRTDLMNRLIDRWYNEWRDQFRQQARDFLGIDLITLDDEALLQHLTQTIDFLRWGEAVHFQLMLPYILRNYELAAVCEELLGWDTAQAMSLVSGTSETSSEPGRRLAELAAFVGQRAGAKKIIVENKNVILRLRESEPEVADAFADYLNEYGHRTVNYEPGSMTLAEQPELLVALLRDRMNNAKPSESYDPEQVREDAVKRARLALADRPQTDVERFERILEAAQRTNPVREDNVFYTDNVPNATIRYTVLEIGRRLVDRGIIADRLDAMYLEDNELRAALQSGQDDLRPLVSRRKAEQAWVAAHPGPAARGKEPGPPQDPGIMPEPWRTMLKAQVWYMNVGFTTPADVSSENEIGGAPGSPGRYTGVVRVIRDESEFSRLLPGDVLVCPITAPAWSILFTQAGAVVTDAGGVLSHAAIIARENGIPAVLGTAVATQRLVDGQTVTVDGSRGIIEVAPAN